jgi:hypothetical protein
MKTGNKLGKVLAFGTLLLLIFVLFVGLPMNVSAAPTTIYVDDVPGSGPGNPAEDYTSIQAAVNGATAGDTIYIYAGTYNEQDNHNTKSRWMVYKRNLYIYGFWNYYRKSESFRILFRFLHKVCQF